MIVASGVLIRVYLFICFLSLLRSWKKLAEEREFSFDYSYLILGEGGEGSLGRKGWVALMVSGRWVDESL